MKKYILCEQINEYYHARSKARNDIKRISLNYDYQPLRYRTYNVIGFKNRIKQFIFVAIDWFNIFCEIEKKSELLIQYPMLHGIRYANIYVGLIKKIKKIHITALIHDINSIRYNNQKMTYFQFLKKVDCIICHNDRMKVILQEKLKKKIISLDIFDYLSNDNVKEKFLSKEIVIAGNLSEEKAGYVYKLSKINNVTFNLYGPNYYNKLQEKNVRYFGKHEPDKLVNELNGSFGLVWDGPDIETCSGHYGDYLKINNPHKTSLYLAAGIPVIVWSKSAIADFVTKEKVGICVNSLYDISTAIDNISEDEYEIMLKNVYRISERLRNGYYTRRALDESLKP